MIRKNHVKIKVTSKRKLESISNGPGRVTYKTRQMLILSVPVSKRLDFQYSLILYILGF